MADTGDDQLQIEKPPKDFFRFLIVDDEPVARNLLRSILQTNEYSNIDETGNGQAALEALTKQDYHIVLLDKNMPGMDGLEVMRRGKATRTDAEFIMITAYGSMETAMEAMDLGAFSYVTKPFADVNIIVKRVDAALEKVVVRRENSLLLERLRLVLGELEQAEQELDRLRQGGGMGAGGPAEQGQAQMVRIQQAISRLRRLATKLDHLRERAKGTAAQVMEDMGKEVSSVADMLDTDPGGQQEGQA